MDDWEKLNKISLPERDDFYSHLNMDITDADYTHAKKSFLNFIKLRFVCLKQYIIFS